METPHKYPSTLHWVDSPEVHRDDNVHQHPENFLNVEVVISEKLDGGNTCLWKGDVYARSTGQPATQGWFAMVKKHHAWKTMSLDSSYQVYGEDLYGIHSIEYEALREDETYRVFNIREDDTWMSWDDMQELAGDLDLMTVPTLFRGTFDRVQDITAWMQEQINLPSSIGGPREGFVMRYADAFHNDDFQARTAKFVRRGHVQTDEHWTKNWKPIPLVKS
jgi:hypothetical protein